MLGENRWFVERTPGSLISELEAVSASRPTLVAYLDSELCFESVARLQDTFMSMTAGDCVGVSLPVVLRESLGLAAYEAIAPHISQVLSGESVTFELRDPSHRYLQLILVSQTTPGQAPTGFSLFAFDLTAQKRREQQDAFLLLLEDVIRPLNDPDEITSEALRMLTEYLDLERASYLEFERDQTTFEIKSSYAQTRRDTTGRFTLAQFGPTYERLAQAGETVVIRDVSEDRRFAGVLPEFENLNIRAAISVQMLKAGRLLGGMTVHQRTPRDWQQHEVDLIEAVANRCWESVERARIYRELAANKDRLDLAQRAGRSGSFDWDIPANRILWSPELEELYGLPRGAFEGKLENWQTRVLPEDLDRVMSGLQRAMDTQERNFDYEFRVRRPDGRICWLRGQSMFVYDETGRPLRMVGINIDIEAQKQTEEVLRQVNRDLEQFAYSVSHDLQEPIRNVAVYAEMLTRRCGGALDEDGREFLQFIQSGAQRMILLVQDLLAYTRTSGDSDEPLGLVNATEVLSRVVQQLATLIQQSGGDVQWSDLPVIPIRESHLQQILQNLVSNGLKYHGPKPPAVKVSAERDGLFWRFAVTDNGIGIEPQFREKIFGMFKRLHRESEYPGTGIGLAICHRLVARYGGEIWVQSEPGTGSTFLFTLPALAENIPARAGTGTS